MTLLSSDDLDEIRGAIRDVTDTFHKKPITLHRLTKGFDRYQEGSVGGNVVADYTRLGFVEYNDETSDQAEEMLEGDVRQNSIVVTFNMNYLVESGDVVDANRNVIFKERRDRLTVQGQKYIINLITYDGLLENVSEGESEYELVMFECTRDEY